MRTIQRRIGQDGSLDCAALAVGESFEYIWQRTHDTLPSRPTLFPHELLNVLRQVGLRYEHVAWQSLKSYVLDVPGTIARLDGMDVYPNSQYVYAAADGWIMPKATTPNDQTSIPNVVIQRALEHNRISSLLVPSKAA